MSEYNEFRETGIWPFSLFPASLQLSNDSLEVFTGKVFDPVVLAWNAALRLTHAGWVGIELMPVEFLWKVVDAAPENVGTLVEAWVREHRLDIASCFEKRLQSYAVDADAVKAMEQAIAAYRQEHFIAAVRTLMPDVERFGRMVVSSAGSLPRRQKEAIKALQNLVGSMPVLYFDALESMTIYKILTDDFFASCFTAADVTALGHGPNRHAELHGLKSYGDLRGATKTLCVLDFIFCCATVVRRKHIA